MLTIQKPVSKLSVAHRSRAGDKKIKYFKPVSSESTQTTLKLFSNEGYIFVKYEDIIYCQALGNYAEIFFYENDQLKSHVVSKTLKSIEAKLPLNLFARCHQSYLIQLDQVKMLTRDQSVLLHAGVQVPLSRRMKKRLLAAL